MPDRTLVRYKKSEVLAMVYCRECKAQVDDCAHFVAPLDVSPVEVFDPKVRSLAYSADARILQITFKNGQVWQLFGVKPDIYDELLHATLSSFLKFLAHRYRAAPVRQRNAGSAAPPEPCPACRQPMKVQHQTAGASPRILWHCERCNQSLWRSYATETGRKPRDGRRFG